MGSEVTAAQEGGSRFWGGATSAYVTLNSMWHLNLYAQLLTLTCSSVSSSSLSSLSVFLCRILASCTLLSACWYKVLSRFTCFELQRQDTQRWEEKCPCVPHTVHKLSMFLNLLLFFLSPPPPCGDRIHKRRDKQAASTEQAFYYFVSLFVQFVCK
eukprot:09693_5